MDKDIIIVNGDKWVWCPIDEDNHDPDIKIDPEAKTEFDSGKIITQIEE